MDSATKKRTAAPEAPPLLTDSAPAYAGRPKPLGDATTHYWMALGMAQTLGLDLQSEMDEGHLSAQDWAGLVGRCRGCAWTDGCSRWLAAQDEPASAPAACPNATLFDDLIARRA